MQMQDRLFCARTRGWRFYERLTLLRSQPVQRTIRSRSNERFLGEATTEFDKQQHTWDMRDRLRVSHKRSKPWPIIFENWIRKKGKKRKVSRSGSFRLLDLINMYVISLLRGLFLRKFKITLNFLRPRFCREELKEYA